MGLVLLAGLAYGAGSGTWTRTGDRQLDSALQKMDIEAKADPDGFLKQLSAGHGIPEANIRQAQETHGLGPADIFMATALARASHRPVLSVAEEYKQNQGKGWGVMAKEMGIKPGSREFRELKRGAQGDLDHMRSLGKSKRMHEQKMKKDNERKMKQEPRGKGQEKSR